MSRTVLDLRHIHISGQVSRVILAMSLPYPNPVPSHTCWILLPPYTFQIQNIIEQTGLEIIFLVLISLAVLVGKLKPWNNHSTSALRKHVYSYTEILLWL